MRGLGDIKLLHAAHKSIYMDAPAIPPIYLLHIPKTAGTSLRAALRDHYREALCPAAMWDDFYRGRRNPAARKFSALDRAGD